MATANAKLHKTEFTNEPFVDFTKAENRAAMEAALKKVASEFGREYPMYINGQEVKTAEKIKSTNPSHPSQVVGIVQSASAEQAKQAIESAQAYFDTWKKSRPSSARRSCSRPQASSGSASSKRRRSSATKSASPGPKRTRIRQRPSTSLNITGARCCGWRGRTRLCPIKTKEISWSTYRWGRARRFRRGIFRRRSQRE